MTTRECGALYLKEKRYRLLLKLWEKEHGAAEERFNPNHDPKTGRFTSGAGVAKNENAEISALQINGCSATIIDVTNEYLRTAMPGSGSIAFDEGYNKSKHKDEIKAANWLLSTFGGNIKLLNESRKIGEKRADFLWKNKYWELKVTHSVNGADKLLQHAVKQIKDNPGGVILDFIGRSNNVALGKQLTRRFLRSNINEMDILLLNNGNLVKVSRYKK